MPVCYSYSRPRGRLVTVDFTKKIRAINFNRRQEVGGIQSLEIRDRAAQK